MRRFAITLFLLWAVPAFAHHSFSSEYNITAQVALKGEVTSVEWTNPHVFMTIAVRGNEGETQLWRVEGGAISALKEFGWSSEMLQQLVKSHDVVGVTGYRARKDSPTEHGAWAKEIELQDGRRLSFN